MANNVYCANIATGGATGSLDSIDGAGLADGDVAFLVDASNTVTALYTLNSSLGGAANPPSSVAPTANAGDKRWELTALDANTKVTLYDGTNVSVMQLISNVLELYTQRTSGVFRVSVTSSGAAKHTAIVATGSGSVDLYHNNTKKFETTATGTTVTGALHETMPAFSRRNALINGGMVVAQRGVSFTSATTPANSDDTFMLDRWLLLSDGNDIVDVTQTTTVPTTGFKNSVGLDVETANKKFGILQILENQDAVSLIGSTVTFSFYAKVSDATKLDNVKAAIIAWSSTADSVTSDIVSAWEDEGTEPTLAANWTYENVPANLSVTTGWVKYTISATIDTASTTNVGVFIWSDVTDTTAGDFLYITGCQLELGSVATPFEYRSFAEELSLCQRYYEKSYNLSVVPGTPDAIGQGIFCASSTGEEYAYAKFVVTKRATPVVVPYSVVSGDLGKVYDATGSADVGVTGTTTGTGQSGALINFTGVDGRLYVFQWTAVAEL